VRRELAIVTPLWWRQCVNHKAWQRSFLWCVSAKLEWNNVAKRKDSVRSASNQYRDWKLRKPRKRKSWYIRISLPKSTTIWTHFDGCGNVGKASYFVKLHNQQPAIDARNIRLEDLVVANSRKLLRITMAFEFKFGFGMSELDKKPMKHVFRRSYS